MQVRTTHVTDLGCPLDLGAVAAGPFFHEKQHSRFDLLTLIGHIWDRPIVQSNSTLDLVEDIGSGLVTICFSGMDIPDQVTQEGEGALGVEFMPQELWGELIGLRVRHVGLVIATVVYVMTEMISVGLFSGLSLDL